MYPANARTQGRRIEWLDGARGVAMLFVFLSHFWAIYAQSSAKRYHIIGFLTLVASPAFVWISGMLLGILHHRNRAQFAGTRDRFIDRGLFLVLVAHPLIAITMWFRSRGYNPYSAALEKLFITDTLGICLIVGAFLVTRLSARARALLGATLLVGAWVLLIWWTPAMSGWKWRLKDVLIGDWRLKWLGFGFPPIPWLGFYLVASGAGSYAARALEEGRERNLERKAVMVGALAVLAAFILKVAVHLCLRLHLVSEDSQLMTLGSFAGKIPPEPAYLLFFGGVSLIGLTVIMAVDRTGLGKAFNRWMAMFGRNSLLCFVLQFYVYYIVVLKLPRPRDAFAVPYFLATVAAMRVVVVLWDRLGLQRLVTVGYSAFAQRWRDSQSRPGSAGRPSPSI
jgi:uncharacterized membrane protein